MLRKKSRERGPNPHSAIRYHEGYVYDPVRNTFLTASLLSGEKKEMISARLKTVTTGPEAMTLPDGSPGWRTTEIGHNGKVYVVDYCGTEVALFYKRQVTEFVPEPGEKVPEGVLQDPKEAWQRLDLLGRSAEKSNFVLTSSQRRLEEENKLLEKRVQTLDDLNDKLEYALENHQGDIKLLEYENGVLKKQISTLKSQSSYKQKKSVKSPAKRGKQQRIKRFAKHRRV